jgi:oligopeptide transport system ATP-binding protein
MEKKVLLSVQDLVVKFHVRGRVLTAIRGISLDIYENESIAIVGESGSGKSVFTKTFANMLDSNGFIDQGKIIFSDESLANFTVRLGNAQKRMISEVTEKLNEYSKLENGAEIYKQMKCLESEARQKASLSDEERAEIADKLEELRYEHAEAFNLKQTLDSKHDKDKIRQINAQLSDLSKKINEMEAMEKATVKQRAAAAKKDHAYQAEYDKKMAQLKEKYAAACATPVTQAQRERNLELAKEVCLSVNRYGFLDRQKIQRKLMSCLKEAMRQGLDLSRNSVRNDVFSPAIYRVKLLDETPEQLHGRCIFDLANVKYTKDLAQIRGKRIATVFQDPMTSLNPILTIGDQISSIILKHQNCSEREAKIRAIELMKKVGIPNAESRYDDYPFQYSGGMRQRIVIAIALSCQPKILICDEPTTALDVTIQAQILKLIKDLQKEFGYTIVFITHDLGVVANIADRVAVLYAGQIVELGTVEDVFYDPRHPYTWAMLSSLPQLAQRNTELYSITGTPPSLYNTIVGDPFAPRNPYCLKIDTLKDAPMFQVSETHFAKTWLLDPRAPKIEKPEAIQNLHEKLLDAFNI